MYLVYYRAVPLYCIGLLSYSAYKVPRGNQSASKDGRNKENKVSPPIRITTTSETTYEDGLLLRDKVKEDVSTVQAGLKEPLSIKINKHQVELLGGKSKVYSSCITSALKLNPN